MLDDFQAKKTDEYFIAIAQQGLHSFIMLGVVVDGEQKLLARVGKRRRPIYPYSPMQEVGAFLFSQVGTDLSDEEIFKHDHYNEKQRKHFPHRVEIKYSAYAITYQQTIDFIAFLETVNERQPLARKSEDTGCCSLLTSEEPNSDGAKLPIGRFNAAYIRVINPQKGINKLYYADKRSNELTEIKLDIEQLRQYDQQIVKSTHNPGAIRQETLDILAKLSIHQHLNNAEWYKKNCTIKIYKPIAESSEGLLTFHYTKDAVMQKPTDPQVNTLFEHTQHFNKSNSCRHTAVELLTHVTHSPCSPLKFE